MTYLLAFFCGALYEAGCVWWVSYSERGAAVRAAMFSMACAAVTVLGLEQAFHGVGQCSAFILGYGCGTFAAVRFKGQGEKEG